MYRDLSATKHSTLSQLSATTIVDIFREDYPLCGYFFPKQSWVVDPGNLQKWSSVTFEEKMKWKELKKRIIFYVAQADFTLSPILSSLFTVDPLPIFLSQSLANSLIVPLSFSISLPLIHSQPLSRSLSLFHPLALFLPYILANSSFLANSISFFTPFSLARRATLTLSLFLSLFHPRGVIHSTSFTPSSSSFSLISSHTFTHFLFVPLARAVASYIPVGCSQYECSPFIPAPGAPTATPLQHLGLRRNADFHRHGDATARQPEY